MNLVARALLIDLDGVIRHWDLEATRTIEQRHGLSPGAIGAAAFTPDLLAPAIHGEVVDREWRARVAERLAGRYGRSAAAAAVAEWSASAGAVDATVLALVRATRRAAPVGLATNATDRLDDDLRRLGIADAFDVVVNSSAVGVSKPDAAFFVEAARMLHVPASDVLFVDDTVGHLAGAVAAGMATHRFTGADDLRRALSDAGLLAR